MKEINIKSRAKTISGFLQDVYRQLHKLELEDELTAINKGETSTVEDLLRAGKAVYYNSTDYGYAIDFLSGRIYIYCTDYV